jgi:hypothetical protein
MARTPIIREPNAKVPADKRLARLEERFRHELMDDEERQELRDRVLALRRRRLLGRGPNEKGEAPATVEIFQTVWNRSWRRN